jgi:uncharacterized protein (DUF305 family)
MRRSSVFISIALILGAGSNVSAQAAGPYDASALMFAQMMVSHHEQAVLISKWALKQGTNSAVRKLAARIVAEQDPQIAQMQRWITSKAAMGMEMGTQGILDASSLATLKAAHGKRFDGLYLVDMTLHHQGAISMAIPLMKSKNPEVAALCKSIVSGQSVEIQEMQRIMRTGK